MSGKIKSPGVYDRVLVDGFSSYFNNRYARYVERKLLGFHNVLVKKLNSINFRPHLIHCHEIKSLIEGVKLKKRFNCKLIFDSHEFFLGYPFDRNLNYIDRIFLFGHELKRMKELFRHVDGTVSVNYIIRAFNVALNPYVRHIVVSNGYIFPEQDLAHMEIDGKIVLVHEGTLSFNRGLRFMVDCFENEWFKKNVVFKIIGELRGKEKTYFEMKAKDKPWLTKNIVQTGWLDYMDVSSNLSGSIGVIVMEPKVNNLLAGPPNKLFNYVSAGLPIITFDIPASSWIVKRYNIGRVVDRKLESFKEGIVDIVSRYEYYKNNVKNARKDLAFSSQVNRLLELYELVLNDNKEV